MAPGESISTNFVQKHSKNNSKIFCNYVCYLWFVGLCCWLVSVPHFFILYSYSCIYNHFVVCSWLYSYIVNSISYLNRICNYLAVSWIRLTSDISKLFLDAYSQAANKETRHFFQGVCVPLLFSIKNM